jgi:hypothetical protein
MWYAGLADEARARGEAAWEADTARDHATPEGMTVLLAEVWRDEGGAIPPRPLHSANVVYDDSP